MIKLPKISAAQLFVMLITSRMFSMFTYKPQKYNIGFYTAALAILVSVFINILIFVPTLSLLKKYEGRNVSDCVYMQHKNAARIYSLFMLLTCLFLSIECLTQFEIFMASTIYMTASPIFFVIPMALVCAYICRLGVESMARMASYVFGGLLLSLVAIAVAAFPKINTVWLEPLGYDSAAGFWEFVVDNVFHTTEIIPFMILASYTKGNIRKGTIWFGVTIGVLFELISFFTITALGKYRETVLFPFYTVAAMAETSLTERFNAAFITLWVFMAVVKLCVYMLVAAKTMRELFSFKNDTIPLVVTAVVVSLVSLLTTQKIPYVNTMYHIIVSGVPVVVLAVVYPLVLLVGEKIRERRQKK